MRRSRTREHLDAWLVQTKSRTLPELQSFACGREKDKDAVSNGLTWSMNNGMVEGQVTKLKLIKRQGRISPPPQAGASCHVMPTPRLGSVDQAKAA
jgi:transposase